MIATVTIDITAEVLERMRKQKAQCEDKWRDAGINDARNWILAKQPGANYEELEGIAAWDMAEPGQMGSDFDATTVNEIAEAAGSDVDDFWARIRGRGWEKATRHRAYLEGFVERAIELYHEINQQL